MGKFANDIRSTYVPEGNVAVFWAGQAGFIIKTSKNKLIALDLYLSDCCERYFGFKRVTPYILEPHELEFDIVLSSHSHYDHFDVDSIPALLHNNCRFVGASDTKAECERLGIKNNTTFLTLSQEVEFDGIKIKGVACDHGELAPEALGLWIEINGKTIYYAGDTAFRKDHFENPDVQGADLLIAPINGMFGNLDSVQAADAAEILKPKLTVPCHFWNFAEHGGDPNKFTEEMKNRNLNFKLMRIGEGIII